MRVWGIASSVGVIGSGRVTGSNGVAGGQDLRVRYAMFTVWVWDTYMFTVWVWDTYMFTVWVWHVHVNVHCVGVACIVYTCTCSLCGWNNVLSCSDHEAT